MTLSDTELISEAHRVLALEGRELAAADARLGPAVVEAVGLMA